MRHPSNVFSSSSGSLSYYDRPIIHLQPSRRLSPSLDLSLFDVIRVRRVSFRAPLSTGSPSPPLLLAHLDDLFVAVGGAVVNGLLKNSEGDVKVDGSDVFKFGEEGSGIVLESRGERSESSCSGDLDDARRAAEK